MKKALLVVVLAAFATVSAVFAQEPAEKKAEPKASPAYVCDKCQKTDLKAGKCCDKDMTGKNVLAIKDGSAICCDCAPGCKCTLKEGDATKCSCGKDVKKVDLKGMFVCEKCKVISDKAGKCPTCGGDLKAVPGSETKVAPAGEPKPAP